MLITLLNKNNITKYICVFKIITMNNIEIDIEFAPQLIAFYNAKIKENEIQNASKKGM